MFDRVRFVLVQPQNAGNVGSAARALKNLGFSRLELVDPACDPRSDEARRMAVDAGDLLDRIRIHPDLDRALTEATTVVGTTRRLGKHRRPHLALHEASDRLVALARAGQLAVLFGREDHGLSDRELDRCTDLVYLPSSREYPSFNLAQAVLLVAYQLLLSDGAPPYGAGEAPPADHARREAMLQHLERAFLAIGFLGRDTREVVMRRLRRALGRAALTREEVKLLRGVARQTLWAARKAGLDVPPGDGPEPAGEGEQDGWRERGPADA
ncbi:MAG TPA: RNA methyltransferase [Candidatus Polarisedimenticolaceae bacterium]|nr:RNA methyltransferase [Candidatus Polarisedimenticolaceae bacterium]